jgi:hypothetical protein
MRVICGSGIVAAIIALSCASVGGVDGAVVLVSNGSSGWTVTRTTSSATTGAYNAVNYDGPPTSGAAALVSPIDVLWTAKNDSRLSAASWISDNAGSASTHNSSDPFYTRYVYQNSFTVSGQNKLDLAFAADNLVDQVVLSTQPGGAGTILTTWSNTVTPLGDATTNGVGRIWGFTQANVQSTSIVGSGTIYITATAYNYSNTAGLNGVSYGFIMEVNATPVPEAATLPMLLLPVLGLMRRRQNPH